MMDIELMQINNAFFEKSPAIVCCKNADYTYLACSKQYLSMLGYSSFSEIAGRTDYDLHLSAREDADIFNFGRSLVFESSFRDAYFKNRLYRAHKTQNKDGSFFYFIEDLEALCELKQKLKLSEDKTEILLDVMACMPGNVYWLDKTGRFQGCNNNVLNMLGLGSREEFLGLTHLDTAHLMGWESGQAESFQKDDLAVLKTGEGKVDIEEPPITNSDGSEVIYLTSRVPLERSNDIVGVVGISIDITARKKAEAALQKAKEQAEAANQAKSDFLAMMTHELRTPLNVVMGMTQLMLNGTCSAEERQDYLRSIFRSGKSLLLLINDILDFGKGQSGSLDLIPGAFRLGGLVEQLQTEFNIKARENGIKYITKIDPSLPDFVKADRRRLRQVMYNLSDNALKFTEKGSVKLILTQIPVKKKRAVGVRIQIKDTGIGIPKDKLESVFEGFTQVKSEKHDEYTRKHGGVGLGLSIVRQIIDRMNATIKIKSTLGKGTTFTCDVEVAIPTKKEIKVAAKDEIVPELDESKTIRASHILLVEDNELNQKVAAHMLRRLNATVDVAKNGKEALRKLKKSYDLVFMDMSLPDMSGPEIVRKFRKSEAKGEHQVIFALSANVHLDDKNKCLDAGMDGFITKPIMLDALQRLLVGRFGYEE